MKDTGPETLLSMRGRAWNAPSASAALLRRISDHGAPDAVARILAARNFDADNVAEFLDPKIKTSMPDPDFFLGMRDAVARLSSALRDGEKIGIWSDYDADGATSAAILGRFLRMCGLPDVPVRIPDRFTEGYGPNPEGMRDMAADGCRVLCILDAGTVAFDALEAARDAGLDVVVIDHHISHATLPPAVAVINPNRHDQEPGYGNLCAAGMTFITAVGLCRNLIREKFFDGKDGRPPEPPQLMTLLDLVALGTVADVVPLHGVNRAFVHRGLKVMNARRNPGIAALAEKAGIHPDSAFTAADCGWRLGPRINAGGRIAASDLGARCLLADDLQDAARLAEELDACNSERKTLEAHATTAALALFEDRAPGADRRMAIAVVDGHEGVVGISASRVKDALDAPAIVLTRDHDGNLKGSARSVTGFDIGQAIIDAGRAGLTIKGGGHGMAGGVTLSADRLAEFETFMNERVIESDYAQTGVVADCDARVCLRDVSVAMIESLAAMEPFGTGNAPPAFALENVRLEEIRLMKGKHFKLILRDGEATADGLIWNAEGTALGDALRSAVGQSIDVLGRPEINEFRGRKSVQLMVEDVRMSLEPDAPAPHDADQMSLF